MAAVVRRRRDPCWRLVGLAIEDSSASQLGPPLDEFFTEASLSAAKWLALVLMIVDHSNKYLLHNSQHWMYTLGRISMPLFAFGYNLARPGVLASGGYRRVAVRLAVFGLLASPAFIAPYKQPAEWWPLNMMFTLLVAATTAWFFDIGKAYERISIPFARSQARTWLRQENIAMDAMGGHDQMDTE